jgi:hypothetical protein
MVPKLGTPKKKSSAIKIEKFHCASRCYSCGFLPLLGTLVPQQLGGNAAGFAAAGTYSIVSNANGNLTMSACSALGFVATNPSWAQG